MMSRSALKERFDKWCEEEGIRRVPSGRKVADALRERGVTDGGRSGNDRFWSGIRWKNLEEHAVFERSGSYQEVLGD